MKQKDLHGSMRGGKVVPSLSASARTTGRAERARRGEEKVTSTNLRWQSLGHFRDFFKLFVSKLQNFPSFIIQEKNFGREIINLQIIFNRLKRVEPKTRHENLWKMFSQTTAYWWLIVIRWDFLFPHAALFVLIRLKTLSFNGVIHPLPPPHPPWNFW